MTRHYKATCGNNHDSSTAVGSELIPESIRAGDRIKQVAQRERFWIEMSTVTLKIFPGFNESTCLSHSHESHI